jgi:hypothetical protein
VSESNKAKLNLTAWLPVESLLRHRRTVLIAACLLAIISVLLLPLVQVNYDMREYLPEDSQTREALDLLESTFGLDGSAYVIVPADSMA